MAGLKLQAVTKSWDGKTQVIKPLTLDVADGEFIVMVGPSGCGKSTLLRMVAGLERVTSGDIWIDRKRVTEMEPKDRGIAMVFQNYALYPHMSVEENMAWGLKIRGMGKAHIAEKVQEAARILELDGLLKRRPRELSGGQRQRVAMGRAIVRDPAVFLFDEPLSNLDAKLRVQMRLELQQLHRRLKTTSLYVTHDQEEALTLSDTIVVMSEGKIQQIGTPIDIYNEPINSFVANFIGESNILNGTMIHDKLVRFCGTEFECVDEGFGENTPVDVVIRPEDLYIFPVSDMAQLTGVVQTSIFKGVHYEMTVLCGGYEFLVQDYHHFEVGAEVGLLVKPFDIHIMKKERGCNTFEGKLLDTTHVEFLGCNFECVPVEGIESNEDVKVEVDFDKVVLQDNEEDGTLTGEVKFILYKGDHYHLTVFSDWDENVFVDTNDVWDDGDRVGITIPPDAIRVIKITD